MKNLLLSISKKSNLLKRGTTKSDQCNWVCYLRTVPYANEDYALVSTQQQLLTTFKKATRQINRAYDMMDNGEGVKAARQVLTKSVLDHHVGLASEIRQMTKARAELDRQYNAAPTDSPLSGPQAIAEAIMGIK